MDAAQIGAALIAMQQTMQQQQQAMVQQQATHAQDMLLMQQQLVGQNQQTAQAIALGTQQAQQAQQAQAHQAQQVRPSSVRPPLAPEYSGKVGTLDAWLASIGQQFEFHNQSTDADCIRTAAVTLRGPALAWWQTIALASAERSSWAQMQLSLRARFQPVDDENVTRVKLLALKQGVGATGISDYISSFRALLVGARTMGEVDKLFYFMHGMREDVARFVRMSAPSTLVDAEAVAIRIGVASQPMSAHAAAASSCTPMETNHVYDDDLGSMDAASMEYMSKEELMERITAMSFRRQGRATTGMDARGAQGVSAPPALPRATPSYHGRTEADMKRLMQKRLCFECQKEGHAARECPTKKSKN